MKLALNYQRVDPKKGGAETYLVDLWTKAPRKVALTQTALAILLLLSPFYVQGKLLLYCWLSEKNKEKLQSAMTHSRFYFIRLVLYGIKGHALVATFRDPSARSSYLRRSLSFEKEPLEIRDSKLEELH